MTVTVTGIDKRTTACCKFKNKLINMNKKDDYHVETT